jgi:adenylate cyclase
MERRLAAIMATDVVGYSRLIRADEEGTLAALKALRADIIDPKLAEHHGRIVKLMGDGMLAEFPSVVDAVRAAVETQRAVTEHNSGLPEDKRIRFRVGINLGDVVIDGDDIHGDGVNVAARLEGLAEAGGICISGSVHDQVRDRLDLAFEDMGEQTVKNIARPIRVWRWLEAARAGSTMARSEPLSLPDKPSIAVLPFTNMSGDPEQEYFADGITQDIVTALSKIAELLVIFVDAMVSHSITNPKTLEVATGLGVSHFLKWSVRKAGNRVRVSTQLVVANTGRNLWAERYDRELTDIFALQDDITQEIVTAMQVNLTEGEQARLRRRQTENIAAWECYVRGISKHRRFTRDGTAAARTLFEQALALDPNFGAAWAYLGRSHWQDARAGWSELPHASLERAAECVERSLAIDDAYPEAHTSLGMVRTLQRRFEEAIAAGERSIDLGPNVAESYVMLALTLSYVGKPEKGVALIDKAMRLSPFYHDNWLGVLANGYRMLGRYEESIALEHGRLKRNPENFYSDFRLAVLYMELGREQEARAHVAEAIKKNRNLSLRQIRFCEPYQDEKYLERYLDDLRKAGLPEE